ncbi:phytoene desaturase family protein [Sporichthya polymorpha]|uniref:phytoene desaturase family protein n=1 Tax=Sporichthya polymorpha TaxID=35751 RepID=UPI00036FED04|nr:FAD-dependent oxidoreductase [Sporichthya polymorpha]
MARVVVIGAGLSGLAVALRLARLKHDVIVCERAEEPGGQAGRFERDGFGFDTGPTLVQLPAGYRDLFRKTGKTTPLESVLDLEPVDPAMRWQFADGPRIDIPNATRAGTMEVIAAGLGPTAAEDWDTFLATGSDLWATFRQGFVAAPPTTRLQALRTKTGRAWLAALTPEKTLNDLMKRQLRDPRLRAVGGSYALRIGSDPRRAAAAVAVWPAMEHTFGTWRVVGGIRRLVDATAERTEKRGAEIRYGTAVTAIEHDGGAVRGVRLADGTTLPADIVVSAVDAALTAGFLGRRPDRGDRSASAFTLSLALDGAADHLPTMSFGLDPVAELVEVFEAGRPPADPTLFLTPADAPAGASALTVSVVTPRHGTGKDEVDWTATQTEAYARHLLGVLDARGFDVSTRLRWFAAHTPADVERRCGSPGGALGGAALHGLKGAIFRPPNTTDVSGLFQVGGSAHPGPGLALAPLGSALVAETIGKA